MPPVNLHLHFTFILSSEHNFNLQFFPYILGNIAPDCINFSDNKSFISSHYLSNRCFNLQPLIDKIKIKNIYDENQWAFLIGYFSHIWFDKYDKENKSTVQIKNPLNLDGNSPDDKSVDEKSLKEKTRNILNYYCKSSIEHLYDKTIGMLYQPTNFLNIEGLVLEKCISLFYSKVKAVHEMSKPDETELYISSVEFHKYIKDAENSFIEFCNKTFNFNIFVYEN